MVTASGQETCNQQPRGHSHRQPDRPGAASGEEADEVAEATGEESGRHRHPQGGRSTGGHQVAAVDVRPHGQRQAEAENDREPGSGGQRETRPEQR
ncbi:hypothetical protein ACFZCY_10470 [Streptomyces sp. NPDC007983]|uniref:hypothetical protein n=1 Tax=Streptomyces sp. NPDC007983 TaxID=3364800 RepID=UPI0036E3A2E4